MCGICGIIATNGITDTDKDSVHKMSKKMTHRGPNSAGFFDHRHVSIGMRRLSIIDLDGGSQPLYNEDRNIVLVANGEIYNFIELRKELEKNGHIFSTKSDCETIVHAYEEYGDKFLHHLRGMFGFCLYDLRKDIVWLVRDRLGEKPLYILNQKEKIIFSSELKSLLENLPKEQRELNRESLYLYFHYGYIPDNQTMIEGFAKLKPGHAIFFDLKNKTERTIEYWNMSEAPEINTDPIQEIREGLEEIEKIIVRSDVPVGVSLSGGIDSSVIATLAAKNSRGPLHAFSVGYPDHPENDERLLAESLARKLGMHFHGVEVSKEDFERDFKEMVHSMDEPIADIAAYGYYSVSKEARKNNVPVLLAGFGADELFWGYDWVRDVVRYNTLKKYFTGKLAVALLLMKRFGRSIIKNPVPIFGLIFKSAFSERQIFYELTPTWVYVQKYKRYMFTPKFLCESNDFSDYVANWPILSQDPEIGATSFLSKVWLVSNCLDLGDRMSMAHSIEMRLPFVDYKLFEKIIGLRKNKKDSRLGHKKWLIEAVKDLIPEEIYKRKKRGFTPPTNAWVHNLLRRYAENLNNGYLIKENIMRKEFVEAALQNADKHIKFLYMALVFEIWAEKYL